MCIIRSADFIRCKLLWIYSFQIRVQYFEIKVMCTGYLLAQIQQLVFQTIFEKLSYFSTKTCVLHVIILLLIQYFCLRPLSRKNMHFSINYIVSVPPFCICACFFLIKAFRRNIELRVKFQLLIKTKIPTNEEVSCFKSHRCCIYHAYRC